MLTCSKVLKQLQQNAYLVWQLANKLDLCKLEHKTDKRNICKLEESLVLVAMIISTMLCENTNHQIKNSHPSAMGWRRNGATQDELEAREVTQWIG